MAWNAWCFAVGAAKLGGCDSRTRVVMFFTNSMAVGVMPPYVSTTNGVKGSGDLGEAYLCLLLPSRALAACKLGGAFPRMRSGVVTLTSIATSPLRGPMSLMRRSGRRLSSVYNPVGSCITGKFACLLKAYSTLVMALCLRQFPPLVLCLRTCVFDSSNDSFGHDGQAAPTGRSGMQRNSDTAILMRRLGIVRSKVDGTANNQSAACLLAAELQMVTCSGGRAFLASDEKVFQLVWNNVCWSFSGGTDKASGMVATASVIIFLFEVEEFANISGKSVEKPQRLARMRAEARLALYAQGATSSRGVNPRPGPSGRKTRCRACLLLSEERSWSRIFDRTLSVFVVSSSTSLLLRRGA